MSTYKFFPRKLEVMEFRTWIMRAMDWVRNHTRTLLLWGGAAAGIAVIVLGGSLIWGYWTGKASRAYEGAHALPAGSDDFLRALEEISTTYGRTPSGKLALFETAEILRARGDHQRAVELYQQVVARTRREPLLRIGSLHAMAQSLNALGKKEEACVFYHQAGADPENVIVSWSRFAEGLCREGVGQQAVAEALYRELASSEEVPMELKTKSEEKLKGLAAKP